MPLHLASFTFFGNKILKDDKEKEVAWYKALLGLNGAVKDFVSQNSKDIIEWRGKQDASEAPA